MGGEGSGGRVGGIGGGGLGGGVGGVGGGGLGGGLGGDRGGGLGGSGGGLQCQTPLKQCWSIRGITRKRSVLVCALFEKHN